MRGEHTHAKPLKAGSWAQPCSDAQFWAKLWGQTVCSAPAIQALTRTGLPRALLSPEDQTLPGTGGLCKGAKALVGCQELE